MAGEFEARVDAAMSSSEDFSNYVRRLETLAEGVGGEFDASSAADLVAEVEDFLKDN